MKKYFYLMALVAMAGFVYTSCSEDDDDSSVNVSLPTPATKELAAKYAIEDPSQSYQTVIDDVNVALTEFEVTEDNGIILKYEEVGTKAAESVNSFWRWHKFTKDGDDKFMVIGFGDIIVSTSIDKRSRITLIPDGVSQMEVMASFIEPTITGKLADYLCRTWKIKKSLVYVLDYSETKDGINRTARKLGKWTTAEADGSVNLMTLIDYANNEHNAGINTDLGERTIVESLVFSGVGTFMINYKGTNLRDVGEWSWVKQDTDEKSGYLRYTWFNEDMGNDLLGGVATVKFNGDEADLELSGKDRSGKGSGTGHDSEYTGSDFGIQFKLQAAN